MSMSLILLPQISGNGYYPYSPMQNQYGTQDTVDTLVQIAGDYFRNQRVQIGIGDMSLKTGGVIPGHKSHKNGRCADIRPLRTDQQFAPVGIGQAIYDRAATELLVQALLAHVNVELILFNDAKITGVKSWKGHDNHLHVKFIK